MSRISHSAGDTAAANAQRTAQAQQKSANAQGARNGAQFAALYRGTTNFTYGNSGQSGPSAGSIRAKRMANQLARKRQAAKKQRRNGASMEDDGPDEADTQHAEHQRVTRDGGGRGGGQSHDDHSDDHDAAALPSVKARASGTVVPPPAGRLDAVAAQYPEPGQEGARGAAVRDAWCGDMLALLDQLAANPQMPLDAQVLEQSIDLLSVQQRIGQLPAVGLPALRERSTATAGPGGSDVARLPPPERAQRFNLLFPLLWLHGDRPSTAPQRARAIDTLHTLRGGVLGRAATAANAGHGTGSGGSSGGGVSTSSSDASGHAASPQSALAPRSAFSNGPRR
jgi:type III secretion regulatory protein HpaA